MNGKKKYRSVIAEKARNERARERQFERETWDLNPDQRRAAHAFSTDIVAMLTDAAKIGGLEIGQSGFGACEARGAWLPRNRRRQQWASPRPRHSRRACGYAIAEGITPRMIYKPGSFVRVSAAFRDHTAPGSPLFDPAAITLRVRNPEGEERSYTPTRAAEGKYFADVPATLPGRWHWRWEADGGAGIDEGYFEVSASAFG